MRSFTQSSKLADVHYAIRGPVPAEAKRMEDEGHRIIRLNIGNPLPFGFEAPDEILVDYKASLAGATGYSDSKGLVSARRAVVQHYEERGVSGLDPEYVWLGNGVSELITMTMQALLDNGDEVLIPTPDYPLWTASVSLAGGRAVHYACDETQDWTPSMDDIRSKITERTQAIVVINPNNPTGAVYPKHVLEQLVTLAREHGLLLLADEIYDKVLYDGVVHHPLASLAPDLMCLTYNGLSKNYRCAGLRSAWLVVSGPKSHARDYLEGIGILANMRLCANHPAQHVIATALNGRQSIDELCEPGGRLHAQRDLTVKLLNDIPGVSSTTPQGAFYNFVRLDPQVYAIDDDERFVLDLLREERVLVVQGTGLNWPTPDHFRIVTLPRVDELEEAITRIGRFLESRR